MLKEVDSCKQESQRQAEHWEAVQTALSASVPTSVTEAREAVVKDLPQEVRVEMELRLDRYFATVAKEFKQLKSRNEQILDELKQARRDISSTHGRVEEVAKAATNLQQGLNAVQEGANEAKMLREKQREVATEISSETQKVIASIAEFDRLKVNCRDCRDKLKLKDQSREEILQFHTKLVLDLASLRSVAESGVQ